MSDRVKLIWDFRGPNAGPIASHHCIHLNEFAVSENIQDSIIDVEVVHDTHHIAYMVVNEDLVTDLRRRLKPNRGQHYKE
ncbi:hypothetical protein [Constantimarinum furrinae]|uniref:Uncharacterized protein n=1 Tax=Constantimarinum furrinae TaxID=2562285 RepID=A0A7G8PQN5_9FLAO|nr:hypothetical protein [Constantimarinum furrinae]QNJ96651.1 hypothetical protein ALE3EI_0060 [Constantimarinum furrinae]